MSSVSSGSALRVGLALFLAVIVALSSPGEQGRQAEAQQPIAPRVVFESTFPMPSTLTPPSGGFREITHYVVEYAPGAQTLTHQHPYGCVATVVEGQVSNRFRSSAVVAGPGKTIVTPAKEMGRHTNDSGNAKAVYFASCFASATESFADPDPRAPTPVIAANVLFTGNLPLDGVPANFDVVQRAIDLEPGATTGVLRANGPGVTSVLEGRMSVRSGSRDQLYTSGQTLLVEEGNSFTITNTGTSKARLVATYALPAGVGPSASAGGPATSVLAAAQVRPPSTGNGGLAPLP